MMCEYPARAGMREHTRSIQAFECICCTVQSQNLQVNAAMVPPGHDTLLVKAWRNACVGIPK